MTTKPQKGAFHIAGRFTDDSGRVCDRTPVTGFRSPSYGMHYMSGGWAVTHLRTGYSLTRVDRRLKKQEAIDAIVRAETEFPDFGALGDWNEPGDLLVDRDKLKAVAAIFGRAL